MEQLLYRMRKIAYRREKEIGGSLISAPQALRVSHPKCDDWSLFEEAPWCLIS